MSAPAFALLGAGEFETWHDEIDRALLDGSDGDGSRPRSSPAASRPKARRFSARGGRRALAHYARLGDRRPGARRCGRVRTPERPDVVAMLDEASLVFFSGGNPWYLATVLLDTPFWAPSAGAAPRRARVRGMQRGGGVPDRDDLRQRRAGPRPGVQARAGLRPGTPCSRRTGTSSTIGIPGARAAITAAAPPSGTLVALDEDTAMVGDGASWTVHGRQGIHLYRGGAWSDHVAGDRFDLRICG